MKESGLWYPGRGQNLDWTLLSPAGISYNGGPRMEVGLRRWRLSKVQLAGRLRHPL